MRPLVLASSSSYRQALLQRLHLSFVTSSPDIDESALAGESAQQLVQRLALAKAKALAKDYPQHLIIGSDQVASLDGEIIGKPHTFAKAKQQLQKASGKAVTFFTGLALYDSQTQQAQVDLVPFSVHFRQLTEAEIERYLTLEQPFDCAGSFKSEGLGVSLFSRTEGEDATSLIGLPLIRLCHMLRHVQIDVP